MSYLYVLSHGAHIRKRGDCLLVERDGQDTEEIEARHIDAAVIFASVQFSTQVLVEFLRHGVSVSLVAQNGRLLGSLIPPLSKNSLLRKAQYAKEGDGGFALARCKEILSAKLENQRQSLIRWRMDNPEVAGLDSAAAEIEALVKRIPEASEPASLLGLEGLSARHYFGAFAGMFKAEGVEFTGRRSHPSPDPVNAALSFGYVMLDSILHSALEAAGFDPYIGFLHEESYGRPSLALDLLEPFRAPVVDRFVVRFFNLGMARPEEFQPDEEGGVRMTPEALQTYLRDWERHLLKLGIRREIRRCVDNLRQVFLGKAAALEPYHWSARP